jgi:hypothetical protein
MRFLPLPLCLTLLLLLPSLDPADVSPIRRAAAQTSDDLAVKCRKAVFRKYGWRETGDGRRVLVMTPRQVIIAVDQCIANGGRVI